MPFLSVLYQITTRITINSNEVIYYTQGDRGVTRGRGYGRGQGRG